MKLSIKQLRRIIRESFEDEHKRVHEFNRNLGRIFSDIREDVLQFNSRFVTNEDPEVDAALKDIEAAMFRLKKALYDQLGK